MSEFNQTNNCPVVTVVIANHNYEKYLPKAIESVIYQTHNCHIKICIYDDGSREGSLDEIINNYKDLITVYQSKESRGPSAARNYIFSQHIHDTDFFAILDADDFWLDGKLQKSIDIMLKNDNVGVVYTDNFLLTEHGTKREFRESFSLIRLLENNYIHSGSVIRADAIRRIGGYREDMRTAEDWDLWLRISKYYHIRHIPEPLVVALVHNQNSTNTVSRQIWQENWSKISETIGALYGKK